MVFERRYPSLGGDPEFFIVKTREPDGKPTKVVMSADKFLPPKNNKQKISAGDVFFDGVQAEINPNPSSCRETFLSNVQICIAEVLRNVMEKRSKNKDLDGRYNFWALGSIEITKETIKNTDLECRRFGCSPDFNIYTEEKIKYPDGNKFFTRFAGGHIHLGFPTILDMKVMKKPEKLERLIKMLDALVGIFSTAIVGDETIEIERVRRKYYGKAGTYRLNGHGIEYRVPSAFWISSPYLASLILSIARDAYIFVFNSLDEEFFSDIDIDYMREIIDNVIKEKAINFYREYIEPMGYKAFLVAVDREACAMYKEELDKHLPPELSLIHI